MRCGFALLLLLGQCEMRSRLHLLLAVRCLFDGRQYSELFGQLGCAGLGCQDELGLFGLPACLFTVGWRPVHLFVVEIKRSKLEVVVLTSVVLRDFRQLRIEIGAAILRALLILNRHFDKRPARG